MKRVWYCLSILLGVWLVVLVGGAIAASPEQTIIGVQTAVDRRDTDMFQELVDLDQIVSQAVNGLLEHQSDLEQVELPPLLAGLVNAARDPGMRVMLEQLLVKEFRSFALYGIRSGHFAGKPVEGVRAEGLLAPMLPGVAPGRKTIRAVKGSVRKSGENRLISVRLRDEGSGEDVTTTLLLVRQGKGWKVSALADVPALLDKVFKNGTVSRQ